jgi:hypothetical protein
MFTLYYAPNTCTLASHIALVDAGAHRFRQDRAAAGGTVPTYVCRETAVRRAGKTCRTVPGKIIDAAIADLLIEMMTPMTLR